MIKIYKRMGRSNNRMRQERTGERRGGKRKEKERTGMYAELLQRGQVY